MGAILGSAAAIFIGTGYITLDTALSWTRTFDPSLDPATSNRNIGLYVLYQLFPLVCIVVFFVLETILVLRVLGEKKPMRESFSHFRMNLLTLFQSISSQLPCCSPSPKSFSTPSVLTSAMAVAASSTAPSSRHSSRFCPSRQFGYSGRALRKTTGRCRLREAATHEVEAYRQGGNLITNIMIYAVFERVIYRAYESTPVGFGLLLM